MLLPGFGSSSQGSEGGGRYQPSDLAYGGISLRGARLRDAHTHIACVDHGTDVTYGRTACLACSTVLRVYGLIGRESTEV
eukprot:2566753-Rhodomonas_salina.3